METNLSGAPSSGLVAAREAKSARKAARKAASSKGGKNSVASKKQSQLDDHEDEMVQSQVDDHVDEVVDDHEDEVVDPAVERQKRLERVNAGNFSARVDKKDYMIDKLEPFDLRNSSRDAISALHLLHSNTGLAGAGCDPLFELKFCPLTDAQRAEPIALAKAALKNETDKIKTAQPAIARNYVAETSELPRFTCVRAAGTAIMRPLEGTRC
jgi:hypothetical protein